LWDIEPLPSNDGERGGCTAVVAKQRPVNNKGTMVSARSAKQQLHCNRGTASHEHTKNNDYQDRDQEINDCKIFLSLDLYPMPSFATIALETLDYVLQD
jgi:hypothetical protein